jgi:hypothetical protein
VLLTSGELEQQARLPHPAGAGQRHQPDSRVVHQAGEHAQLIDPPDQLRDRLWEVRGSGRRVPLLPRGPRIDRRLRLRAQPRVALEDLALQLRELVAGLEAKLLGEPTAGTLIRVERLRLPVGAVQREHQLSPHPLLEGMLGGEARDLGDELARSAVLQIGVDPEQPGLQAFLLQRAAPLGDAALGGDVGQRLTPEQAERLAKQRGRPVRIALRLLNQVVEPPYVELEAGRRQRVTRRIKLEQPPEQRAQLREVDVQRRDRARRRAISP